MRLNRNTFLYSIICILIITAVFIHFRTGTSVNNDDNVAFQDFIAKTAKVTRSATVGQSTGESAARMFVRKNRSSTIAPQKEPHRVSLPSPDLNFALNFTNSDLCTEKPYRQRLIAMIFSAPNHFENRAIIRVSWVKYLENSNVNGSYFFVIGETNNAKLQRNITAENIEHNDILQYDFVDSYRNLTYKTLAGLKFLKTTCKDSKFDYVLKVDDDIVVNVFEAMSFALQHRACGRYRQRSFFCQSYRFKDPVPRSGKWGVTHAEYPEQFYPRFCAGPGYMFTRDMIGPLLEVAKKTPFYHLEDVFVGMCADQIANVSFVQFGGGTVTHLEQNYPAIGTMHRDMRPVFREPDVSKC